MADDIAVKVENVTKTFRLPHEKVTSVKGAVVNFWNRSRTYEKQQVLHNVSFEIKKGEFFGIVGRNGSGKSTLLKLLAGIYSTSNGSVRINGKLTPFIELGVGFSPELSGRENVFLNGALLGFSRKEIEEMYNDIVAFAELERFMDQKLKNYSSGMHVRLAFSIAVKAQSEILLIDEVLAVGDAAFQKKCFDYFMKLKKENKTVVLVTHDMSAVRQYCDRGIMIENGEVIQEGKIEKVAQAYQKMFNDELSENNATSPDDSKRWGSGKLRAQTVDVRVKPDKIVVTSIFKAMKDIDAPIFGFNLYNARGMNLLEGNTKRKHINTAPMKDGETATLVWEVPNVVASDTYSVSVSCCNEGVTEFYDWLNDAAIFIVPKEGNTAGFIDPPLEVSYKKSGR